MYEVRIKVSDRLSLREALQLLEDYGYDVHHYEDNTYVAERKDRKYRYKNGRDLVGRVLKVYSVETVAKYRGTLPYSHSANAACRKYPVEAK